MKKNISEKLCATAFMLGLIMFSICNLVINHDSILEGLKERNVGDNLLGKTGFIELYGATQLAIGKQEFNNFSFVKDDDGFLHYATTYKELNYDMELYAGRVRDLREYVESYGKKFLFAMAPDKSMIGLSDTKGYLPINNQENNMDLFLWKLSQNGVDYIDLRQCLLDSGLSYEDLYFKTDHHWTTLAAFHAAGAIVEKFEELYNVSLDPGRFYTDINHYHYNIAPNCVMGSSGDNTGNIYAGDLEDMQVLTPTFETSYFYAYESKEHGYIQTSGPFEDTLLNKHYLEEGKTDGEYAYLQGIHSYDEIINELNPDAPSVLVLRDSYFSPVAAFLSPMFSEMHMVWVNTADNPGFDIEEHVQEYIEDYDYVIMEIYSYSYNEHCFGFFDD